MGMRLSDYIVRVLIYCNLPGLLHQNAGSELILSGAGNGSDHTLPDPLPGGECCHMLFLLSALQPYLLSGR